MGLSTHVLDTMHGTPAGGMAVSLYTTQGENATLVRSFTLNEDGRSDAPLYDNQSLKTGTYRLVFDVAGYFKARGVTLPPQVAPEPKELGQVLTDLHGKPGQLRDILGGGDAQPQEQAQRSNPIIDMLGSPQAKAVLAGIAAMVVKRVMQGSSRTA